MDTLIPDQLAAGISKAAQYPQPQSGVLAYRRSRTGDMEVLLIKKADSKRWGIPKGKLEPGLTPAQNAAKEAFEEAGILGCVNCTPSGSYLDWKQCAGRAITIDVSVHMLEVMAEAEDWPERLVRQKRWCAPSEAAALLHQPLLSRLCRDLVRTHIGRKTPVKRASHVGAK